MPPIRKAAARIGFRLIAVLFLLGLSGGVFLLRGQYGASGNGQTAAVGSGQSAAAGQRSSSNGGQYGAASGGQYGAATGGEYGAAGGPSPQASKPGSVAAARDAKFFKSIQLGNATVQSSGNYYPATYPMADTGTLDLSPTRSAYTDFISRDYNFRFGEDHVSTPGNAVVEGGEFIEPGAFPSATYCGHCHQQAYHEWRQALHSNSFRTPFYRRSVNILINTKGIEFARHCDSCHNPIAVLAGGLTQNSHVDRKMDENGLTCMFCHSVQRLQPTDGNGSFVLSVPAVMTDAQGRRIAGEVPFKDILQHPDWHARAVMNDTLKSPLFCASCHKASLPRTLNDYKFLRAFTAYDEWQNSKFSQQSPLPFYKADFTTCQGCHMKREPATLPEPGAKNGTFASHNWPAGNTAVPFYYGFDEQLQKTIAFLKAGNYLNVDIFALRRAGDENMMAPLGSVPVHLEPNEVVEAMVVVQNKNIGHSLIPEVRDLYEAWVEFQVKDASGREIYHSGFLKPDGSLDPRAHSFTNRPVTTPGDFVDDHKVWAIHTVAYDNTIQAGRSVLIRYEFHLPGDVKGPVTITARVNYRHFRQSYLNNIFGPEHPAYPVVEIQSRTRTLNIGETPAATTPDPQDNPDWMRWNNLGIALLDQLQYGDALRAFQRVVQLRPDYIDGYVNEGLLNIEWERYSDARPPLEHALAIDPNYARALYYMGIVERREGHPEKEIKDLESVVEQFPLSRDAHRELAVAYYQAHNYPLAKKEYEAVQQIDPDDLAAHYNLALIYRRLGMKAQASEQAAFFATKEVDPQAPTSALTFLRNHPESSVESVPWHMHTDLPEGAASGAP
jgi:Tfp pilus assembly protein PilF